MAVGRKEGLCNAGRYAMDNMRVEYGLATMGNEIGSHTSPWEAGLNRAIDLKKVQTAMLLEYTCLYVYLIISNHLLIAVHSK